MRWLLVVTAMMAAPAFAQSSKAEDEAGDVSEVDKDSSGPLRDRIPPVSGHAFLMDSRFEISPELGISLRDAFFTKYLFGAALTYHFTETFALSLRGGYTASIISGAAQVCAQQGACRAPTFDELTKNGSTPENKAYGLMTFMASLDVQWSPIYGKLSLIGERTLHFDAYLSAGPELVREQIARDAASPESGRWAAGGRVSLGERLFVTDRFMVRAAVSELIYAGRVRGLSEVERKLSFEGGVAWLFGGQ